MEGMTIEQMVENAEAQYQLVKARQDEIRAQVAELDGEANKWLKVIRALAPERLERTTKPKKNSKGNGGYGFATASLRQIEGVLRASFDGESFTGVNAFEATQGAGYDFSRSYVDKAVASLRELGVVRLDGRAPTSSGKGFAHIYKLTPQTLLADEQGEDQETATLTLVGVDNGEENL